jgi:hypothetical protein
LEVAKLDLEESLSTLSDWSSHINLVFNHTKTKIMVFTTRQIARYHGLDQERRIEIGVNGKKNWTSCTMESSRNAFPNKI